MRYISVCSGIEAASVAWGPLGWKCVGVSEIEPFPCSVLQHRFPDVPNLGDMNNFKDWLIAPESIDVLVGGTPCQSFSIAGLRGGLTDDRGNLALTYCRILQKFRPKWFVWENVPGVLSSNGGRDFGSILGAMEELGYGIAYRVLDAQHFGVPQRRRRVFVVGCLGDWRRAAEVLFEPGCLRGDTEKGGKKRKAVAALTATGVKTCGADDNQGQAGHLIPTTQFGPIAGTLTRRHDSSSCHDRGQNIVAAILPDVAETLMSGSSSPKSHGKKNGTDRETLIPVAYQCHGTNVGEMGTIRSSSTTSQGVPFTVTDIRTANTTANGHGIAENVSHTLDGANGQAIALMSTSTGNTSHCLNAGGMGRQDYETETMVVSIQERAVSTNTDNGPDGVGVRTDGKAYTLEARSQVQAVAFTQNQRDKVRIVPVVGALSAQPGMKQQTYLSQRVGVRRLTPVECERLQGFPTCIERVTIDTCLDHQKENVHVVLQCRKSPSNVLRADGLESNAPALSADTVLWNDQESREAHVAVHVRMSHEPRVAGIRSAGKWIWCASGAGDQSEFPLPVSPDDFARDIAAARQALEASVTDGKAGSLLPSKRFTLPVRGGWRAAMFGLASEGNASDAESSQEEAMRFITSNLGRNMSRYGLSEETWLCFALNVTSSCIRKPTQPGNSFKVVIDVESDWTLVPHRGKPAADGPRYKAIGNSMAVPVMRWIGERIKCKSESQ